MDQLVSLDTLIELMLGISLSNEQGCGEPRPPLPEVIAIQRLSKFVIHRRVLQNSSHGVEQ